MREPSVKYLPHAFDIGRAEEILLAKMNNPFIRNVRTERTINSKFGIFDRFWFIIKVLFLQEKNVSDEDRDQFAGKIASIFVPVHIHEFAASDINYSGKYKINHTMRVSLAKETVTGSISTWGPMTGFIRNSSNVLYVYKYAGDSLDKHRIEYVLDDYPLKKYNFLENFPGEEVPFLQPTTHSAEARYAEKIREIIKKDMTTKCGYYTEIKIEDYDVGNQSTTVSQVLVPMYVYTQSNGDKIYIPAITANKQKTYGNMEIAIETTTAAVYIVSSAISLFTIPSSTIAIIVSSGITIATYMSLTACRSRPRPRASPLDPLL